MSISTILGFLLSSEGLIVVCLLVGLGVPVTFALILTWDEEYNGDFATRQALFYWDAHRDLPHEPEDGNGPLAFSVDDEPDTTSCNPFGKSSTT